MGVDRLVVLGSMGERSYHVRLFYRESWRLVAARVGYSSGRSAHRGAERYARRFGLSWPIRRGSIGSKLYSSRLYGISWLRLSRLYGLEIGVLKSHCYKWATRNDKLWPPS